jgi:hypothetical protein
MKDIQAVRRAYNYLRLFKIETNWFKFKFPNRRVDSIRINQDGACKRIKALINIPKKPPSEWLRGWLAGIFDSEGSGNDVIRIHNKAKNILDMTIHALKHYHFMYKYEQYKGKNGVKAIRVSGSMSEYVRFFSITTPAITRKFLLTRKRVKGGVKVSTIMLYRRARTMYDITTDTKNFVCNGLISHNCYAQFTKRFTGHKERWGDYVDVKVNAPELLAAEIKRKPIGTVWISGVCDPYQPLEAKYKLTRQCLEILLRNGWPVNVQTRSPLVLRDLDLLKSSSEVQVTMSITTADDSVRRIFEPKAPPIRGRVDALGKLHAAGVRTQAMIAPMLPGARGLAPMLVGKVDSVLIDRMNYAYANHLYRAHHLEAAMSDGFFRDEAAALASAFRRARVACRVLF